MLGTVITWRGDKGVVAAAGQRYDFDISHWDGAIAPAADMTVEVVTSDGRLETLRPLSEADLAKEKLAAITGEGSNYVKAIFAVVGADVAIAYGVFFFIAMFVSVMSTNGFIDIKVTLADLLSGDLARAAIDGGSGKGIFLILLATATIALPYFLKHKLAPLAFAVPLLITVYGLWPLYEQHHAEEEAIEALGELGQIMGRTAEQLADNIGGPFDSLGIGAWILFATVIYLAFRGVIRSRARA